MKSAKANVVVAIPTNGSDGREHMSGVFDYVNEHPHWIVQTINMRTAAPGAQSPSADSII